MSIDLRLKDNVPGCIFVFGSNLAGAHGAGAALHARKHWGAKIGEGRGRTGQAYAIPTKSALMKSLSIDEMSFYVHEFVLYAKSNTHLIFIVTPFGAGLAGNNIESMRKILIDYGGPTSNMIFTASWIKGDVF